MPSDPLTPRSARLALAALLVVVTAIHLVAFAADRPVQLWGDEGGYAIHAKEDAASGATSVLPGKLPFRTQPEFASRLYSKFADAPRLLRSVSLLNIGLLPLVLLLTYAQARQLDLSRRAALVATALLACFPWFGFHVHSLWPEVLHALFFGCALLGLLSALRTQRLRDLCVAGVASAFALFTKGVLYPFVPLFAVVLAVSFYRGGRTSARVGGVKAALLAPAVYLGSILLVLLPQLIANERAGHGYHLAANRWWNLELGLTADPRGGRTVGEINTTFLGSSEDPMEREALARERTLAYVRDHGVASVIGAQLRKLARMLFERDSSFERSIGDMQRYGPDPPWALTALRAPARVLWYALLGLGLAGVVLRGRSSAGWFLLAAFVGAFFAAAATVPLKARFLLPVVPVLCLFTAATIERVAARRNIAADQST